MTPHDKRFNLEGGLNITDAPGDLKPGEMQLCRNYDVLTSGRNRRIKGYERFDGRTSPSKAVYRRVSFTAGGTTAIAVNDMVLGATSAGQGTVVGVVLTSGSWAAGTAAGELGLTNVGGPEFVAAENLTVGAAYRALCAGASVKQSRADTNYRLFLRGAQAYYRAFIGKIPGTGGTMPMGVWFFNGLVYVFRYDTTSGLVKMYKSDPTGWIAVGLGKYIKYVNGTAEIFEGNTITGFTSGATALVQRINVASGAYAGPTFASGRLAITNVTGAFVNGENLQVGGVTKAVSNGANGLNALNIAGYNMEFVTHNFSGVTNKKRMYGVNGLDPGFEFDGTVFIFNDTAMVPDAPTHLAVHKNHLFYSFAGGSIQNSGTTLPRNHSPRTGATEIYTGNDITCMQVMRKNTLSITTRESSFILYGENNTNWDLKKLTERIGALPHTMEEVGGQTVFLDDEGAHFLTAALEFGDFLPENASRKVLKAIKDRIPRAGLPADGVAVTAHVVRRSSQYRLTFYPDVKSNGALYTQIELRATFNGNKLIGWSMVEYPEFWRLSHACSENDTTGAERTFALAYNISSGGDAYVVEVDVGTSFDGADIQSVMRLPYTYEKSPFNEKRWLNCLPEIETVDALTFQLMLEFNYGEAASFLYSSLISLGGGLWNVSNWNDFLYDQRTIGDNPIPLDGVGRNASVMFYHKDDLTEPFTIHALTMMFVMLGLKR